MLFQLLWIQITILKQHIASQLVQYKKFSQQFYSMPLIWHTVLPRQLSHQFEDKYTIFLMEEFSMILLEFNEAVGIDVDGH